jgi:hypothetical protein
MTLARELADTAGRPQVDKNLLINGGMNVWQRSTSVTGITSGGYKTVDRWDLDIVNSFGTGAGTWTMAQSTDVPANQGFAYSTKIDMTATGDQVGGGTNLNLVKLDQYIEGQNVQHLLKGTSDAKALTLSFWVKSTKASNFVVTFTDPTNNRKISKEYTIDTANTWEKKTILIPGDVTGTIDNDNTSGFTVEFWLFAGLGYLTGTLATSWGSHAEADWAAGMLGSLVSTSDDWSITGVQLEVGEAATDFQFEPYANTLQKCQRYYHQLGGNAAYEVFAIGVCATSTLFDCLVFPPVKMRQNCTVSSVGSNFKVYTGDNSGGDETVSSIAALNPTPSNISVRATTSSATVGRSGRLYANNDTTLRLKFDAEL